MPSFTLRGVRALDAGGGFTDAVDVEVTDGVVAAVGKVAGRGGVDASGLFLMPGMFDCHCHLGCFTDDLLRMASLDVTQWMLEVVRNARLLLELGVTSVRDVATGTPGMRNGFADGAAPGPQLFVSGPLLSQIGGHGDGYLPSVGIEDSTGFFMPEFPTRVPHLITGADQTRATVRKLLRLGVDWVKLCTTGGLLSQGLDHPLKPELTDEEILAAVDEAGRAGVPVACHAYGGPGLDAAVRAGVTSIEHGLWLTEEQAAAMAERGTWFVPTLAVFYELDDLADRGLIGDYPAQKVKEIMPAVGEAVAIARAAGVRIAAGTDLVRQGPNLSEITHLHHGGLTTGEALLAATAGGAELCGVTDRGRIAPGMAFDAILLDAMPEDLSAFMDPASVTGVFQDGRVVRAHPQLDLS